MAKDEPQTEPDQTDHNILKADYIRGLELELAAAKNDKEHAAAVQSELDRVRGGNTSASKSGRETA